MLPLSHYARYVGIIFMDFRIPILHWQIVTKDPKKLLQKTKDFIDAKTKRG